MRLRITTGSLVFFSEVVLFITRTSAFIFFLPSFLLLTWGLLDVSDIGPLPRSNFALDFQLRWYYGMQVS